MRSKTILSIYFIYRSIFIYLIYLPIELSISTDPNGVLGELQFAFICFLMGQSFDGFEQWKQLIAVLCSCEEAMQKYPDLFYNFLGIYLYTYDLLGNISNI